MRGVRALSSLAAVLILVLASGGCSFRLGSMFEPNSGEAKIQRAGSIGPVRPVSAQAVARAESDAALRAAASELLTRNEPNASMPWENPQTGARGTVTPIASGYTLAGATCRDFLASYVQAGSEDWLQGEACRERQGQWEVRSLKPWTRS
ncbi:MAG: hypothetical protein GEU91_20260 [Rhizobiales bacterium]|nr:hypothetical protein [Hyphomicrobiales bacterium]